jgi:hypothetical protein
VALGEALGLWLLLALTGGVPLGLREGLLPVLRLLVGEADREELRLLLLLGVNAALLLLL